MKNIFIILSLIVNAFAQNDDSHSVKEYEEFFNKYKNLSEKVALEETYKDAEFEDKSNPKNKIKFKDLTPFHKNLFYLYRTELLSNALKELDGMWKLELNALENKVAAPVDPKKKGLDKVADKKDVENYLKKLLELRKAHAVRYEQLVEKVFKEYKNEIPEKERELYLKSITKMHDDENLVERPNK